MSKDLVGLAFSGGGIRSACFNLGLLQALHKKGVLRHVDFLSTVSGGGYIGSHLASLVLQPDVRLDREKFPLQPKADGRQPRRVLKFIQGGKYLLKQPVQFVLRYISGLLLNSLVVVSGLIAACALLALAWRALDTTWADLVLKPLFGEWIGDSNRPFLPAALLLVAWTIVWGYSFWQSRGEGEGRAARIVLLLAMASLFVGAAVLIGNMEVSGGPAWMMTYLPSLWGPLAVVLAICLLPILQPWRLLKSGTRPSTKLEPIVFRIASVALLAGIPLVLVGYLARENISGHGTSRTEFVLDDEIKWYEFQDALHRDFEKHWRLFAKYRPPSAQQSLNSPKPFGEMVHDNLIDKPALLDNLNAAVMEGENAKAFAKAAASEMKDGFEERMRNDYPEQFPKANNPVDDYFWFWTFVKANEDAIKDDIEEKSFEPKRFEWEQEYLILQSLLDEKKATLDKFAERLNETEPKNDKILSPTEIAEIEEFNRLFLEAAYPGHILNRRIISRSIVIGPDQWFRLFLFLGAFGVFVVAALLIDPNLTSIHGYYRRQLANAYIEPVDGLGRRIPLCRLETSAKGAPYLLINATLNMFGRRGSQFTNPTYTFLFSKRFCGSIATEGCPTSQYLSGHVDLANAMAISGAAVSPLQVKNPLIAAVMLVLNLRLGQWFPNPREGRCFLRPTIFRLLLDTFRSADERHFCMLSDGGHHDNLGLYSLLKRECQLIILSDASQDRDHVFAEFAKVYRRLRTHLGVEFFDLSNGKPMQFKDLIPRGKTRRCRRHHVAAGIRYSEGKVGVLLYVKLSMTGDEEIDLERYRASNPDFPHQPTSDQFFDEDQVESYRQLGFHIGEDLCKAVSDELWAQGSQGRLEALVLGLTGRNWSDIEKIAPSSEPLPAVPGKKPARHADPEDVPTLLKLAKGRNKEYRNLAVKSLQGLDSEAEAVVPVLITLLKDPDKDFRSLVAYTLGTLGSSAAAAVTSLKHALQDDDAKVRDEAAWALDQIGVETAIADLQKAPRKKTRE